MQQARTAGTKWVLWVMPGVIFAMGSVADLVLNAAVSTPEAARVMPQLCGLTVGMLTVLTFALRRQAYLVAAVAFIGVEMVGITLGVPLVWRAGVCVASLVTAGACLLVYLRGPWDVVSRTATRQRDA